MFCHLPRANQHDTCSDDGFIGVFSHTSSRYIFSPPNNHCSFVEHPAGCKVSSLRGPSRVRFTRLNANTKSGNGGSRRTMFQFLRSIDLLLLACRTVYALDPKGPLQPVHVQILTVLCSRSPQLLSRQSSAISLRCSTYSNPCLSGEPVKPSSHR